MQLEENYIKVDWLEIEKFWPDEYRFFRFYFESNVKGNE